MIFGPEIPAQSGNTKQLVVLLHGVGANGDDLISLVPEFVASLPDAHFISPHAPQRYDMVPEDMPEDIPVGFQWFSLQNRSAHRLIAEIESAVEPLDSFIKAQLEKHQLQPEQLILIGFSQGSMMALYYGLYHQPKLAGILGYSGAFVPNPRIKLRSDTQICLIHGTDDEVVPHALMEEANNNLLSADLNVVTHSRPYLGHGIDFEGITLGEAFLKKVTSPS